MNSEREFSELLGKTLKRIQNIDNEILVFTTAEGEVYRQYHDQECCESVRISDICGDLGDLIGLPLLVAEEVYQPCGDHCPDEVPGLSDYDKQESFSWTFYKLDTMRGGVTIRWIGTSNGYYSERVATYKVE